MLPVLFNRCESEGSKQHRRRELSKRVFSWLSCSLRPLSIDALAEAVTNVIGDETIEASQVPPLVYKLVVQLGGPVVKPVPCLVPDQRDTPCVQFVHLSVQEFLLTHGEYQRLRPLQKSKISLPNRRLHMHLSQNNVLIICPPPTSTPEQPKAGIQGSLGSINTAL